MDDYVDFKLKKNKDEKLMLFVLFKEKGLSDKDGGIAEKIIEKYSAIIEKYKNLHIFFDTRNVKTLSPKLVWEKITVFTRINGIAKTNVVKTALLIGSPKIKNLANVVKKVYPFVVPTVICSTNEEAMNFLEN